MLSIETLVRSYPMVSGWLYYWGVLSTCFHLVGALSAVHAILCCRTSEGAIGWSLSLFFCPYLALPAYWVFGKDKFTGYVRAFRASVKMRKAEWFEEIRAASPDRNPPHGPELAQAQIGFERLANFPMTNGNQVDLLVDGHQAYGEMFQVIRGARRYLLVEFFIIQDDRIGREFQQALIERARSGVKVYLVYDEFGCLQTPKAYFEALSQAGVRVVAFAPSGWFRGRLQINFRNHRKILVADGEVAHVGGINIIDDTLGRNPFYGDWRDTNVSVRGPAVLGIQAVFARDFHWASKGEEIHEIDWTPRPLNEGDDAAVYVASGPADEIHTGTAIFLHSIHSARRRIWLTTPYFLPTAPVFSALKTAVLRGVDVQIIIPLKRDILLTYLAAFPYLSEALQAGIQVQRYKPGYIHQKVMLIDEEISWVGSSNMDARSMDLNFEGNLAVLGRRFAETVERMLKADLEHCQPMTRKDLPNGFFFQLAVKVSRLFENIL